MVKRKRLEGASQRWAGEAESVWTGMADWRVAHPKATFSEIEAALDERLNQVRARVLADLALASAAAELQEASAEERPRRERCGTVLQARGASDRTLLTQGGASVRLERTYATCPTCGDGTFPPGR
jgi:NMD protein affecting ribosome stability and mRNA decay